MQTYNFDEKTLKAQCKETARRLFSKELKELNPDELNSVIAHIVKEKVIAPNFEKAMNIYSEQRIAVYMSMEFLIGRVVNDVLNNTGLKQTMSKIFEEEGIDINCLEDVQDAALGNGGLGRLAACFIESAATMGYPLYGMGLYYKYGLFKQEIDQYGNQIETADDWTAKGEPWFEPDYDKSVIVEFRDTKVKAVPYVMPVIGYSKNRDSFQSNAFPLTLWKAEPIDGVTNESAARISDYLYPNDESYEGKQLRIRQEYFFTSATMQMIFKTHLEKHSTLDNIEDYYIFQMNDTHPVFGCLEFIRLLEQNGYTFEQAFEKAHKCFAYTNHTVLSEALEKWPISAFKNTLPGLWKIIEDLNQKLVDELKVKREFQIGVVQKTPDWGRIREYELFAEGVVHMSRIACFVAYKINGVAAVHTEIIKNSLMNKWYRLYPERFCNITNGITPRRWIELANPGLAQFLDKHLNEGWRTDLIQLEDLEQFKNDPVVLAEFAEVKHNAKATLIDYIYKHEGVHIDSDSIIDCQVKRIHEYKRQLMNVMRILYIYDQLKQGNLQDFYKTTFVIGGKSASSYKIAKQIISLIKDVQEMVNNDPDVNDKMQVVFLTNFNVSYGEKVYAGANFSEQISTAGKEASGTGNMKFMMNGAPTIGTMDGANIEIVEEAGTKNSYIFGATVDEFDRIWSTYNHQRFLEVNQDLVDLIRYLEGKRNLSRTYWELADMLRYNDRYFVMYDLKSYIKATLKANKDYAEEQRTQDLSFYTRKCLKNTAHSGKFSSDRTIQEYVDMIWHIEKVQ